MINWKTERWKVSDLKPYENNPRKITKKQRAKLAKQIERDGDHDILKVTLDGTVLSGNQRLSLYVEKGVEYVDVKVPDRELTKPEIERVVLSSNITNGDWDLDELFDGDWDPSILDEFDFKMPFEEQDIEEDNYKVSKVLPKVKKGEIWQLGEHRLMIGDSRGGDPEVLMGSELANMVFTDPPYGVNYQSNMRTKSDKFDVLEGDGEIDPLWIVNAKKLSNGFIFLWTTWRVYSQWEDKASSVLGDPTNLIVWNKGGGGLGDLHKTFSTDYELALVWNQDKKLVGSRIGSVWSIGKDASVKYLHPTQKPVALAAQAIQYTTRPGDIVLDFFGGSGSTLIACEQLGRKCRIMELDTEYASIIIDRWEKFTNMKAKLING